MSDPREKPWWVEMLFRLDDEEARLAPYKNADGSMTTPAASRSRMLALITDMRHVIRYAADAEQGNAELRKHLAAAAGEPEAATP